MLISLLRTIILQWFPTFLGDVFEMSCFASSSIGSAFFKIKNGPFKPVLVILDVHHTSGSLSHTGSSGDVQDLLHRITSGHQPLSGTVVFEGGPGLENGVTRAGRR